MKHLYLMLFLITSLSTLQAQTIDFNYTDSSNASYNVSDIRKITFTADIMNLHFNDGSLLSWNVNSIGYYTYNETTVNVENHLNILNQFKLNLFPNPTNHLLNLSFDLPSNDNITISIFDLQGKVIIENNFGNLIAGTYTETIDISTLETNSYVFRFSGNKISFTKTFIKNN
ncbi:MAG TPA: T9SS type A sorting domain-containing protein [Bacteroidia bacterium]|nr:T9SS type A sorting domain-containing protein [Bacteroidia bacterium]